MSDTNDSAAKSVQDLAEAAKESAKKKITLDPYIMLKEIQQMREDGVDEETLREAFEQLIAEHQGNSRKPQKTQKESADKTPMLTQAEINKMYEDAVRKTSELPAEERRTFMGEDIALVVEEAQRAMEHRKKLQLYAAKPTVRQRVRMTFFRVLHFGLTKFLSLVVWIFNKAGIK